jgi:hypothetical protein
MYQNPVTFGFGHSLEPVKRLADDIHHTARPNFPGESIE